MLARLDCVSLYLMKKGIQVYLILTGAEGYTYGVYARRLVDLDVVYVRIYVDYVEIIQQLAMQG